MSSENNTMIQKSKSNKLVSTQHISHIMLNGTLMYCAKKLKDMVPAYFFGTSKSIRHIVKRKNIPVSQYLYATYNKRYGLWTTYTAKTKPNNAGLYINKNWADEHIIKQSKVIFINNTIKQKQKIPLSQTTAVVERKNTKERKRSSYEMAPDLITLPPKDTFCDYDGNTHTVEMRGERHPDKCFFLVHDIAKAFGLDSLSKTITANNTTYERGVHYKTFTRYRHNMVESSPSKIQTAIDKTYINDPTINTTISNEVNIKGTHLTKALYLTYKGVLKVIFSSRTGHAEKFANWATRVLFTHQFGTRNEIVKLCASSIGYSLADARRFITKASATSIGCVYLLCLNTVKHLRNTFNIPDTYSDDQIVCKLGLTDNLTNRLAQHNAGYNKMPGVDIRLIQYALVDQSYQSAAEVDFKEYCIDREMMFPCTDLQGNNHTELIIIKESSLRSIKKQLQHLGNSYGSTKNQLIEKKMAQITELKHIIELERTKNNMAEKQLAQSLVINKRQLQDQERQSISHEKIQAVMQEQIVDKNNQLKLKDEIIKLKDESISQLKELAELRAQLQRANANDKPSS